MRTRSSKPSTADEPADTTSSTPQLVPGKPLKTLILPTAASDSARFVTLRNPATGRAGAYFFCPDLGVHEITRVGDGGRSVLFTPDKNEYDGDGNVEGGDEERSQGEEGYVSRDAQLHIVTPVDVMFFVVPVLAPVGKRGEKKVFQPLDDILDDVFCDEEDVQSRNLRDILLHPEFRKTVERRMMAVCDTVEAGETMFRVNEEKLVGELFAKAERMVKAGLPASMEERFVRRELEVPVLSVSRDETKDLSTQSQSQSETHEPDSEVATSESQESNASSSTSATAPQPSPDTPITPPNESQNGMKGTNNTDETIIHLLRLRTSLFFLLSSYVPAHVTTQIEKTLTSPSSPQNFTPLTTHLAHIASLRAKAHESRALYNNVSRKRGFEEEEDVAVARAEKKKKEEEEKKKKAGESRGVRDLKKVNTSGMKKLSAFFGKAASKK